MTVADGSHKAAKGIREQFCLQHGTIIPLLFKEASQNLTEGRIASGVVGRTEWSEFRQIECGKSGIPELAVLVQAYKLSKRPFSQSRAKHQRARQVGMTVSASLQPTMSKPSLD